MLPYVKLGFHVTHHALYILYYFFDSDNDSALQSHISLPFLPFLISTMLTTGAHTGFQGILLGFKLIVMYLKHTA